MDSDEFRDHSGDEVFYHDRFSPFGEIILGDQNIFVLSNRGFPECHTISIPHAANGHEWLVECHASSDSFINFPWY